MNDIDDLAYFNMKGNEDDKNSDSEDEHKHQNLRKALRVNDAKKRVGEPRSEAASRVSEFEPIADEKVKIHELFQNIPQHVLGTKLKKRANRIAKTQKSVEVPLHQHEQQQIQRVVAYEGVVQEVGKWDSVVKENRKASQLIFPLNQPHISMKQSTSQFVSTHQPRTPMELQIASLLKENRADIPDRQPLSASEELALRAKSLEEAEHLRGELQKHRALMSYYGAKFKRQGKIKSKKYHRIQRKVNEKKEEKALERMRVHDPEVYNQTLRRAELARIKERMSLKHKGMSRVMKKQTIYGKFDPQSRQAVQDMIRLGQELRAKTTTFESESDAEESSESSDDEKLPVTDLTNPWMSGKVRKKSHIEEQSTEHVMKQTEDMLVANKASEVESREDEYFDVDRILDLAAKEEELSLAFKKTKKIASSKKEEMKDESANKTVSERKRSRVTDSKDVGGCGIKKRRNKRARRKTCNKNAAESSSEESDSNSDEDDEESDEVNDGRETISGCFNLSSSQQQHRPVEAQRMHQMINPNKIIGAEIRMKQMLKPDNGKGEDGIDATQEDEETETERMTLADAFADDNVAEDFIAEKKTIVERDRPKDIDMTLPGWGDWTGPGIKASQNKRKRFVVKAPPGPARKDALLKDVIISEIKDVSIAKHQVNTLPFPFTSVHAFQDSLRKSVGSTLNKVSTFKKNIKPKVITRMGAIIAPISKSETFQKQLQGNSFGQNNPAVRKASGKRTNKKHR